MAAVVAFVLLFLTGPLHYLPQCVLGAIVFTIAVGLVDVKNTWIEPAELVADRLRQVLRFVDPARVSVTPDCGFSQTARHVAAAKVKAMVEGVRIVRQELEKR